jgi:cytochrome P450
MGPYLGSAPETSRGATWAHGRAVMRSAFAKAQVNKVDIYEKHFQVLTSAIPTNQSTVDLKALFSRMTLDVSTELFFGEPLHAQRADAP